MSRIVTDGISSVGDEMVRTALYKAANVLLSRVTRFSAIKRWRLEVAKRSEDQGRGGSRMVAAYHGKAAVSAVEVFAVNPFAPAAQTTAWLRGCDSSHKRCRHALQGNGARTRWDALPITSTTAGLRSVTMRSRAKSGL